MIFKNDNFDGTNNSVIEIVSSYSELNLLKRSGNENIKVALPLSLCIGKLNSDKPFDSKILSEYYKNDDSFDFTSDFEK